MENFENEKAADDFELDRDFVEENEGDDVDEDDVNGDDVDEDDVDEDVVDEDDVDEDDVDKDDDKESLSQMLLCELSLNSATEPVGMVVLCIAPINNIVFVEPSTIDKMKG